MAIPGSCSARFVLTAVLSVMSSAAFSQVAQISNAAYSGLFEWDCRSAAAIAQGRMTPDRCEANGGLMPARSEVVQQTVLGGFAASTVATRSLGISGSDASGSSVDASSAAGAVRIGAGVFSGTPYSRVSVQSEALQSFLYTGPAGQQRSVRTSVNFISSVPPSADFGPGGGVGDPAAPATFIGSWLMVLSLAAPSFEFNASYGIGASQFMAAAASRSDFRMEGDHELFPILASGASAVVSFVPEPGRYYFIETYLGLWSRFGGQLDSRHTMAAVLGFGDELNFVPGSEGFTAALQSGQPLVINQSIGSVPEPSTRELLIAALLVVSAWVQSRRSGMRGRSDVKSASSTTR